MSPANGIANPAGPGGNLGAIHVVVVGTTIDAIIEAVCLLTDDVVAVSHQLDAAHFAKYGLVGPERDRVQTVVR